MALSCLVKRVFPNIDAEHVEVECCRKPPRREHHIFSVSIESSAARCFDLVMCAGRTSRLITRLIRATSFVAVELPFRLAQNALMAGWLSAKASGESSLVASNILTAREGRLYLRQRDVVVSDDGRAGLVAFPTLVFHQSAIDLWVAHSQSARLRPKMTMLDSSIND